MILADENFDLVDLLYCIGHHTIFSAPTMEYNFIFPP